MQLTVKKRNSLVPKVTTSNLLPRETRHNINLPHVAEMIESSEDSEATSSE